MHSIHLSEPTLRQDGSEYTLSCTVRIPGRDTQELWITGNRPAVTDRADAFVALCLLPAMKLGVPLVSEAPVSQTLLEDGVPKIQRIYRLWREDQWNEAYPEFHRIDVVADSIDDLDPVAAVGCFYSGGVDSSFSLVEAQDEITDLIFIRHFETVFEPAADRQAIEGVSRVAEGRGKRLIVANTNAKTVFGGLVSWHHYHGGFLAAIALLYQDHLSKVHVPSSYSIRRLRPWGSHPLVDPLWSTGGLRIEHDRVDVSRLEKTAAIADEPLLMQNLRVCWQPVHNCGMCPKCVRTRMALQVLDKYEMGYPFECPPIQPGELEKLDLRSDSDNYTEIDRLLNDTGKAPDLLVALNKARVGYYHTIPGTLLRGDVRKRARVIARRSAWRALRATGTLGAARQARSAIRRIGSRGLMPRLRRGSMDEGSRGR